MSGNWTVTVSRPGVTDQTSFPSEAEAIAYADNLKEARGDTTVAIVNPEGASRIVRSYGLPIRAPGTKGAG